MINEEKHDDGHLDEKAGKNTDILARIGQGALALLTFAGAIFLGGVTKDKFDNHS